MPCSLVKNYRQDEELDWGACVDSKTEEQKDRDSRAAHAMKELRKESAEYKQAGSTLKASREKKKKNDSGNNCYHD